MKILVTGGSGMVGRNLLNQKEFMQNKILAPPKQSLDLFNFNEVKEFLRQEKPDLIIHCAGHVGGIQANIDAPLTFLLDNLEMGKNLVMAARQIGIPRLMNLGSSCMYPKDINDKISEEKLMTGVLEPTNEGYALAKIVIAKLCDYISQTEEQLFYKTIVPCNLYGEYDHFDIDTSHLIPAIIVKIHHAIVNHESTVEIWGDGKARREFMYAGDLAEFITYALDRFDQMPALLNVGVGYDYSVNEYYNEVAKITDYRGSFTHDTSRATGMQRKLTDITRLSRFGWKAKTNLATGLSNTYRYFKREIVHA